MSGFDPYEGDEYACIDDYPEHDYVLRDEVDGDKVYDCRRCGAELIETAEDSVPSGEENQP